MKPSLVLRALLFSVLASVELTAGEPVATSPEDRRAPALAALRDGNLARADQLIKEAARGSANTAAWHLDYAELLMSAAIDLQDRSRYKESTDYYKSASAELEKALKTADAPTDTKLRAHILYQLGFIARVGERDLPKANAYFKRSLGVDAENVSARAALQRTKDGRVDLDAVEKERAEQKKSG